MSMSFLPGSFPEAIVDDLHSGFHGLGFLWFSSLALGKDVLDAVWKTTVVAVGKVSIIPGKLCSVFEELDVVGHDVVIVIHGKVFKGFGCFIHWIGDAK